MLKLMKTEDSSSSSWQLAGPEAAMEGGFVVPVEEGGAAGLQPPEASCCHPGCLEHEGED